MISRRTFLSILLVSCLACFAWLNLTPTASAMGGKQPPLNEPAPEFTLPSNSGDGEVSLADYQGKWVVLYFYPKDFTSGCTL
ncbi:MAG TPA: peroxiredoxin, partial [Cyanobacteria bacterium UBA11162]|nr:peroxiredoxin [Cyanobacteria bacterium UBA11162]